MQDGLRTMCAMRDRTTIWLRARRLDETGNALIEAALVFPILFILFFGVSELCEGFIASRRVEAAAFTAADLVARLQTVNSADLVALKSIIDETIKPLPVATVGLVVTSVVADENNITTRVAWSEAFGPGVTAHTANASIVLPAGLTLPNSSVIFAQVSYTFRSTLSTLIVGGLLLRAQAYQQPRFAAQVARSG
jgi:Flp pilus assembly protein TadG